MAVIYPHLVSVIVPTYNRAASLGRCLNSLTMQTYKSFEVLVCDDGSIDETQDVVCEFYEKLNIKYFKNENSGGPARPRNIGIINSTGKYLAFLDSDDWWAQDKLEKSVIAMEGGADLIYHDLYIAPIRRLSIKLNNKCKTRVLKAPVFEDLLLHGNAVNTSSVLVRRDLMVKIGGFSEDQELIAAEDFDAWLRLSRVTDKFQRMSECLGYYEVGGNSLSSIRRRIVYLNYLKKLYSSDLYLLTKQIPIWIDFALGIAYFRNRNYLSSARVFLSPKLWFLLPRYLFIITRNIF